MLSNLYLLKALYSVGKCTWEEFTGKQNNEPYLSHDLALRQSLFNYFPVFVSM